MKGPGFGPVSFLKGFKKMDISLVPVTFKSENLKDPFVNNNFRYNRNTIKNNIHDLEPINEVDYTYNLNGLEIVNNIKGLIVNSYI